MPKFKIANRVAWWLKGHADGIEAKTLKEKVDKIGLSRLKTIIANAGNAG